MNLKISLTSALLMLTGLGWNGAIAAEPQTHMAQRSDVCRQAGEDYREVYTIDEETRSITICQKEEKYFYVAQEKAEDSFDGSSQPRGQRE